MAPILSKKLIATEKYLKAFSHILKKHQHDQLYNKLLITETRSVIQGSSITCIIHYELNIEFHLTISHGMI